MLILLRSTPPTTPQRDRQAARDRERDQGILESPQHSRRLPPNHDPFLPPPPAQPQYTHLPTHLPAHLQEQLAQLQPLQPRRGQSRQPETRTAAPPVPTLTLDEIRARLAQQPVPAPQL